MKNHGLEAQVSGPFSLAVVSTDNARSEARALSALTDSCTWELTQDNVAAHSTGGSPAMTFGESLLDQIDKSDPSWRNVHFVAWLRPIVEQAVKDEREHRAAAIGTRDWQAEHFGGHMDTAAHPLPPIPAGLNARYPVLEHPHANHPAMHASMPSGSRCTDCGIDKEPCPTCYSIYWSKKHSTNHTPKETP